MQFKGVCLKYLNARTLRLRTQLTSDGEEWIEHTGQKDFFIRRHFRSQEFQCERIIVCILYNLLYVSPIVQSCTRHGRTIQTDQMMSDCNVKTQFNWNSVCDECNQNSTIYFILLAKCYGHLLCIVLQFQIDGIIEHLLGFDFRNVVIVIEY